MKKLFSSIICLVIITVGCKEKYLPAVAFETSGYLVVEGFISSSQQPTSILLTRTTRLYDSVNIVYEHNAVVNIESENNETFPLYENGNGAYISSSLNLNSNEKYRLHIKTQDNKEYVSDFAAVKHTPAIDSISWLRENGGLRLYINTHDPQNNTRYYQWDYSETWEFHSAYLSSLIYVIDPSSGNVIDLVFRDPIRQSVDTTIYKCWTTTNSTTIILGSSEKLTSDKIYLPLLSIAPKSEKLSILYSIIVSQHALSHEAFIFFQKIKKNTEQLGSLFDPQPSELQGNIHCITNPAELVIGYIDISEEKEKRIFISSAEVPGWNYEAPCDLKLLVNQWDSTTQYGTGLSPTEPFEIRGPFVVTFFASSKSCVDCTLKGTNIKPSFWP
ncbi:MAG: DUF4249 domain-containing protein [Ginsengibacter sp.]